MKQQEYKFTTAGAGYDVGDTLTVAAANMGNPGADLVLTLVDADIVDGNAFVLESLGEGQIMNSAGALNSLGALANGTPNNLRWQITSPDTGSGTFSVLIRRGNDTSRAPAILESFNGVSLDPTSPNYISRIIGDQTEVLKGDRNSRSIPTNRRNVSKRFKICKSKISKFQNSKLF